MQREVKTRKPGKLFCEGAHECLLRHGDFVRRQLIVPAAPRAECQDGRRDFRDVLSQVNAVRLYERG